MTLHDVVDKSISAEIWRLEYADSRVHVACCAAQRKKIDICEQSKTITTHFAHKTKLKLTLRKKCQSMSLRSLHFIWKRRELKFNKCPAVPGAWAIPATWRAFAKYRVSIADMSHQPASRESVSRLSVWINRWPIELSAGLAPSESGVPKTHLELSSEWHINWCESELQIWVTNSEVKG